LCKADPDFLRSKIFFATLPHKHISRLHSALLSEGAGMLFPRSKALHRTAKQQQTNFLSSAQIFSSRVILYPRLLRVSL
jgi:hypothetical protein